MEILSNRKGILHMLFPLIYLIQFETKTITHETDLTYNIEEQNSHCKNRCLLLKKSPSLIKPIFFLNQGEKTLL